MTATAGTAASAASSKATPCPWVFAPQVMATAGPAAIAASSGDARCPVIFAPPMLATAVTAASAASSGATAVEGGHVAPEGHGFEPDPPPYDRTARPDAWVLVCRDGGTPYFWNFATSITLFTLPPGHHHLWTAHLTLDQRPYYQSIETQETVWNVPGMLPRFVDAGWLVMGTSVSIKDLCEFERYNGQVGEVVDFVEGRATLDLAIELGGTCLRVRPENLQPLPVGTIVECRGLTSRTDINGQVGFVVGVDAVRSRCEVRFPGGGPHLSFKWTNLRPRSRLWNIDLRRISTWLRWEDQQCCIFVDSEGVNREFYLHLPLGFQTRVQDVNRIAHWPMLFYLHGAGGKSLFSYSKRSMTSEGLQYAAATFVVVSPVCLWNWKDRPQQWVEELLRHLRAAD